MKLQDEKTKEEKKQPKKKEAPKKKGRPDPEVQKRKLQEMIKKAGGKDEYLKQLSKTTKGKQGAKFKALAAFQPKKKEEPKKKEAPKAKPKPAKKKDVIDDATENAAKIKKLELKLRQTKDKEKREKIKKKIKKLKSKEFFEPLAKQAPKSQGPKIKPMTDEDFKRALALGKEEAKN